MSKLLGEKMVAEQAVSRQQLREALTRQRLHGGRLGENLVALGYLSRDQLGSFFHRTPPAPASLADTGLNLEFVADLALKHSLHIGEFRLADLAARLGLPATLLDEVIELLRREKLVEVRSASQFVKSSFRFIITETGKVRAGELLDLCQYTGPAPVTLDAYREMVECQSIRNIQIDEAAVRQAFSKIVLSEQLIQRLGPAVSSGAPIFIYGPAGNGKTTIAEAIGNALPETVYVPHAILVGGQIVGVFDPVNHTPVEAPAPDAAGGEEDYDRRWVKVHRPVVITGGELTMRMLDLEFNPIARFYEAPLQMKANNGLFIVDDFGRQQISPQQLLNRWIVNLDRQIDFLSLHTGMKFEIPFDQLVIFATNLEPRTLVDEAFLRRMRYKIKIDHPSEDEFRRIFQQVCTMNGLDFNSRACDDLIERWYRRLGMPFNACHPRDLVGHLLDRAHYSGQPAELTREALDRACENYFVEM
ncbi:MAG: ATPase [Deltaproteobacteria bacterium]|nr:MAG: ATPase [Deltaproteobacteria bacterium]